MIEFSDAATSELENAVPAASAGPTIVVKGDLTLVSDPVLRTVSFSTPSGAEITPGDVTLANPSFVIPAADYSVTLGQFNLVASANLIVNNDRWLEGDEAFSINISSFGDRLLIGNANGDTATPLRYHARYRGR